MSKTKYILSALLALVLTVSVSFMSVGAAEAWGTKIDISTKNSVTKIYNGIDNKYVDFKIYMDDVTSVNYPVLFDFGMRSYFQVGTSHAKYFVGGKSYFMATDFTTFYNSSDYNNLKSVSIDEYRYFTLTVSVAVTDDLGNSISGASINSGLTSGAFVGSQLEQRFVDFVYDKFEWRCYTFGISTLDIGIPGDLKGSTVASLLTALELFITPNLPSNRLFYLMMSDIRLSLYSTDDVIANGITSIEDAINKSNQAVIDKLDEIYYGEFDTSHETVDTSMMDEVKDDLGNVNDAISAVLPEYDESILTGIPSDLDPALTYVGSNLERVLDYDAINGVILFCLSFGLAMTIIGRSTG